VSDSRQDAFPTSHFSSPRSKSYWGRQLFACPFFRHHLQGFFLAQPPLFFSAVDFLVAVLGISPHPLRQENLALPFTEVNKVGRTTAVRTAEAFDNHLCVGK
jgi:hypothetical protein